MQHRSLLLCVAVVLVCKASYIYTFCFRVDKNRNQFSNCYARSFYEPASTFCSQLKLTQLSQLHNKSQSVHDNYLLLCVTVLVDNFMF